MLTKVVNYLNHVIQHGLRLPPCGTEKRTQNQRHVLSTQQSSAGRWMVRNGTSEAPDSSRGYAPFASKTVSGNVLGEQNLKQRIYATKLPSRFGSVRFEKRLAASLAPGVGEGDGRKNRAMNPMHRGVPPLLPVDHVLFDSLKNVFRLLVVGQFESKRAASSSTDQTWAEMPASIAGVTRKV